MRIQPLSSDFLYLITKKHSKLLNQKISEIGPIWRFGSLKPLWSGSIPGKIMVFVQSCRRVLKMCIQLPFDHRSWFRRRSRPKNTRQCAKTTPRFDDFDTNIARIYLFILQNFTNNKSSTTSSKFGDPKRVVFMQECTIFMVLVMEISEILSQINIFSSGKRLKQCCTLQQYKWLYCPNYFCNYAVIIQHRYISSALRMLQPKQKQSFNCMYDA